MDIFRWMGAAKGEEVGRAWAAEGTRGLSGKLRWVRYWGGSG